MLLREYQEHWTADFNSIKKVLEENILTTDIEFEHIGSTSVRSLAAKPIIDIDISYVKHESFRIIELGLQKIGYCHHGNQGIEGREVFKRDVERDHHLILDSISHHLYVCQKDGEELRRHLIFRDHLRENARARIEYEKLKYKIARRANQDRKKYAALKEVMAKDFIESILKQYM